MTDRNVILPVTARDRSQYGAPSWAKFKIIFRKDSNYPDFRGTKFYRNEEVAKNALIKKDKLIQTTKEANLKSPVPAKKDKFLVKVGKPIKENNVVKQKFKEVIGSKNVPSTYKPTGIVKDLYKAQIVVGDKTVLSTDFGTKADATAAVEKYRKANPIKNPPPDLKTLDEQKKKRYLDKQAKSKAITERGGYYSGPHTGTTKAHLGHTGNVFGIEKITGDKLAYTPAEINQAMSAEGAGLDSKIRKVSEKIEKLKKQNLPPARKKKLLEQADALLVRLASQSQGFKKVTLSDGSTFGGDRLTIDMFNEFPNQTEREINEFVKKWKDKKTWDTAEEFENIKKAKFFDINRKNALKAAEKIGKTEQTKVIEHLNKFIKQVKETPGGCQAVVKRALGAKGGLFGETCEAIIKADPERAAVKLNNAITATKGPLKNLKDDSQKLIRLFRGESFPQRNIEGFKSKAKFFNTTIPEIKKDTLSGQWFTPNQAHASSYLSRPGRMKYVDVTPAELESFNRYKAKVNRRPVKYSVKKMQGLPDAPTHGITTSEFHQVIPRYKLKQMEEAGRLKTNYDLNPFGSRTTGDILVKPTKGVLEYDSVLGGFVDSANPDELVGQNQLKAWAEENPMKVEVGTELPKANKSVLKTVGRTLAHIGAPLPTALIDGYFINKQIEDGKSTAEIAKDPLNWLGLATMEPLTKIAGANSPGGLNAVLRLGLNPATIRGITRFAGLPGLAISTAMTAYDQYKKYQNEEGFVYNLFNKEGT